MKNHVIRYGIYGGSTSIVLGLVNWFTISQMFGYGPSQVIGYLSIILALLCIPLGIRYYRDELNSGVISFSQSFKIGMGITLMASFMVSLYSAIFFILAGDDFMEWRKKGLTESELEQLQAQMAAMPDFAWSPWFQGLVMFVIVFLVGLVINFVSSLVLKSVKKI